MQIILSDKSVAVLSWFQGRCSVKFRALRRTMDLPVGVDVTVSLVEKLYSGMKTSN